MKCSHHWWQNVMLAFFFLMAFRLAVFCFLSSAIAADCAGVSWALYFFRASLYCSLSARDESWNGCRYTKSMTCICSYTNVQHSRTCFCSGVRLLHCCAIFRTISTLFTPELQKKETGSSLFSCHKQKRCKLQQLQWSEYLGFVWWWWAACPAHISYTRWGVSWVDPRPRC